MEVTKEQAIAYTEVIEILKYMSEIEVSKIPRNIIEYYKKNRDISYNFKVDTQKSFEEQELSEKTKIVLAILFRDYWATEEQRNKIKQKEKYDLYKIEQEKQEKFSSDNLFETKQERKVETALIEYKKENWYNRFIDFIKKIFSKNK